jgi:hypothetical protein
VSVTPTNPPGPSATVNVTPLGGGYVLDGWGGLHGFASAGPAPPATAGGPYWAGWSIARGVALLPSGSGGYVLDAYGGLHPFAVGSGPAPPAALGGSYWNGWDIARGVTILNDGTGGYVIDGYGGLHPFAVGAGPMPPPVQSPSYWLGWDIVHDAGRLRARRIRRFASVHRRVRAGTRHRGRGLVLERLGHRARRHRGPQPIRNRRSRDRRVGRPARLGHRQLTSTCDVGRAVLGRVVRGARRGVVAGVSRPVT